MILVFCLLLKGSSYGYSSGSAEPFALRESKPGAGFDQTTNNSYKTADILNKKITFNFE